MKRKLFSLFLLLTLVFAVGCNKKDKSPDPTPTPTATSTPTPTPTPINLAKENLEKLVEGYDTMLASQPENQVDFSNGIGYDITLDVSLGKQIMGLLGITGLDTIRLSGTMDAKDTISANLGLYLNSDEIVKALVFMDEENLLFNLPKYATDYAKFSWEELLASEDEALADSLGSITTSMNPAESMALSEEITNMFRTHLASLTDCFKKVDGITENASIGTGDYTMTGDKYTVSANPADVISVLKAFEADMEKYYGELDFGLEDLESSGATALFLDYYTDENGSYAWAFHTNDKPDGQIVFINTDLGFCLYNTDGEKQTLAMTSLKSDEKTGVIYLYDTEEYLAEGELPEAIGTIDYEYEENSIHADIEIDTIEATVDYSIEGDIINCDMTLVMDGMSFVLKETASKEHVEATFTLASYGIEYATIDMDVTLRDYVEAPAPSNAVDLETWAASLDSLTLLTDLTELMQKYPFLAALLNLTGSESGSDGL